MSDEDKLIIEIELDDGKLAKGFIKAEDVAKKSGKKSGKDFGDGANEGASLGLNKLKASILAISAVLGAAFATGKLVRAAVEQEDAINSLNASLRNAGKFTPQLSNQLQEYAEKLESVSSVSADGIRKQIGFALTLGATAEQAKKIVAVSNQMSVALGTSFESAVQATTKTLTGVSGKLGQTVTELKGLSAEQLKAGVGIDILSAKFKGFAEANLNTFKGSVTQLANKWDDFLASLGKFITQNPLVIATIQILSKKINGISEDIKNISDPQTMLTMARGVIVLGQGVVTYVVAPLELAVKSLDLIIKGFILLGSTAKASGSFVDAAISKLASLNPTAGPLFKIAAGLLASENKEATNSMAQDWINLKETASKTLDFDFSLNASTMIDEIASLTETLAQKMGKVAENSKTTLTVVKNDFASVIKDINGMIKNGLARGIGQGVEMIGASLVTGELSFANFGNAAIALMGDLAIQVGMAILSTGLAIESLKASILTMGGGIAIAAGIALIALGGALKAFVGANGGAAGANSTKISTGGDSFGSNAADAPASVITDPEANREERRPTINVNISGDVLDSDEAGMRIVDIINGAFDQSGVKIRRGAIA